MADRVHIAFATPAPSITRELRASRVPASLRFRHDASRPMKLLLISLFRGTVSLFRAKKSLFCAEHGIRRNAVKLLVNGRSPAAKWGKTRLDSLLISL
jgi:hypothetical protein